MVRGEVGDGDDGVVEADFREQAETLPRFLRTAAKVEVIVARERPAVGREVDRDVRRHRPTAALALETAEPRPEGRNVREMGGSDPSVIFPRRDRDPAAPRPASDEDRRTALRGVKRGQVRLTDRFASPEGAHDRQVLAEGPETRAVVVPRRPEVGLRRPGPDAEPDAPSGQVVNPEHPVGELHGPAKRNLKDAGAELDPFRHRGRRGHGAQRVDPKRPPPDRVEEPDPVESDRFGVAHAVDEGSGGRGLRTVHVQADAEPHPVLLRALPATIVTPRCVVRVIPGPRHRSTSFVSGGATRRAVSRG